MKIFIVEFDRKEIGILEEIVNRVLNFFVFFNSIMYGFRSGFYVGWVLGLKFLGEIYEDFVVLRMRNYSRSYDFFDCVEIIGGVGNGRMINLLERSIVVMFDYYYMDYNIYGGMFILSGVKLLNVNIV